MMARLAVIGVGKMGEALVRGLLSSGWPSGDVVVSDIRLDHARAVASRLGVDVAEDNKRAANGADGVVLAVTPADAGSVLDDLRDNTRGVVSIVMGLSTDAIEQRVGAGVPVVRAMPNILASIGKGVTALAPGSAATDRVRKLAEDVFGAVGPVAWVSEQDLDAVTALSGSGPAYVYLVAEALVDGAVTVGLSRDVATTLAYATIEGAARMLIESGEHPAVLRAQVTSKGGTTAAGVSVLEAMAVRSAFIEAIRAAHHRARDQARGAGS